MLHLTKYALYSAHVLLLFTATMTISYTAEKKDAPLLIPGTIKVFAEDILELAEKIPELIIIDARIGSDRKQGYIQDSINLPDIDTNCSSLAKVIPTKQSPVLFYCNGVKCKRSLNSSKTALMCGYSNIYWFRGGFVEWKAKQLPFLKN